MVAPQETVRFITKFEDFADTTMPYMYHCHILMHEDDGMMGQFVVVPSNTTGLIESKTADNQLKLFPNPVQETLKFELPDAITTQQYSYRILNSSGSEILFSNSLMQNSIAVSDLKPGYYILLLKVGSKLYQGRFIK
jgi:bilirubin oxidase